MTLLKFEVATLAAAIKKAARVAPTKAGKALDSSAGLMIEIHPAHINSITLRATNLEIFYLEAVNVLEMKDGTNNPEQWRLSSSMLAAIIGSFPIGSDQTMTMEQIGTQIQIKQNRTSAKLNMMTAAGYPSWGPVQAENLVSVEKFGAKIATVEWAASKRGEPPFTGVHLNGHAVAATDKYRLAMIPCVIPLEAPITIPSGVLGAVIRAEADVSVGMVDNTFLLMPDEGTQIRTVIYDTKYPSLTGYSNLEPPCMIEVNKTSIIDIMNRATLLTASERDAPTVTLYIGKGEFACMCTSDEVGLLGDVIWLNGSQAAHPRAKFTFTPQNIIDPIMNAPEEKIKIYYDPEQPARPFKIDGGSGYLAIGIPRAEGKV